MPSEPVDQPNQPVSRPGQRAILALEDGLVFEGRSFGRAASQ